jgi:peptidoglycan hydrolase-like protein with peptidoglycan-binding domain
MEGKTMKRLLTMLGIGVVIVGGLSAMDVEARGAARRTVQDVDQGLVRDAQRQLKALGYDPGAVDGHYGPQTEAAVRAYQHAYRLPETGRLDDVTLRSLLPEMRQSGLR